ncbi:MAG: PLP-dependent transferase [Eubacteriales bacterium]|jgi:O-acetylhomoserine (thiol)-lyase|nr:PLP-dependent transferase [Lachnospiraceae bacterium]MDD5860883.1 PLP-dependent transferase [Eubacteriales bacterium]MCH4064031.1 PLP-dependent transferase [Lachnospiraceae bacterium]MCH4103244.1 PLP-dependent transferase [Lachnospiraceae bacterium]MCI1309674.1 PLP-dependent transferase [Lachnospiraceae bacterium]
MKFNTRLLHGRAVKRYAEGATVPPIAQVTAFSFPTAEEQANVFQHKAAGFAYSRVGNPTVAAFETRLNELEGGNACIACSSGMSAITLALLNMLCAGDEIIAGCGLYGGSIDLFEDLTKFGIKTRFVRHMTVEEIEPLVNERTRVIFGELIGNPGLEIMDVPKVAEYAHHIGVPLIVDSTTATPYIAKPLELGADIVVHSASKYINGGGNSVSGAIIDGAKFKWDFDKFEALSGYRKFGILAYTIRLRTDIWENMGSCLSPMNAYLNIIGLETLGLRMERICQNAETLARALDEIPGISVNYPTLPGNPYRELAERELQGLGGGILTFRAGSKEKAYRVLDSLQYVTRATSIGDFRSLAIHPASTLYIRSTPEMREAAGVFDDTIRVSVGIEDVEDLIDDFRQALKA